MLVLRNAQPAPFAAIGELFERVTPERAARANAAYCAGSSRLVWKDAHGEGRCGGVGRIAVQRSSTAAVAPRGMPPSHNTSLAWGALSAPAHCGQCVRPLIAGTCRRGGPHVDIKRVIDLSPHRMESLTRCVHGSTPSLCEWGCFGSAKSSSGEQRVAVQDVARLAALPRLPNTLSLRCLTPVLQR